MFDWHIADLQNDKVLKYCLILALVFIIATSISPVTATGAGAGIVDLVLLPATPSVESGNSFILTIQVKSNGQEIDGIDAFLDFNPEYLKVQSVIAGEVLDTPLQNRFDNSIGTIDYAAGKLTSPFPFNTFTLATIGFVTKPNTASTTTNLDFHLEKPRNTWVDYGGKNVTGQVTGATVNILSQLSPSSTPPNSPSPTSNPLAPPNSPSPTSNPLAPPNSPSPTSNPLPSPSPIPPLVTAKGNVPTSSITPIQNQLPTAGTVKPGQSYHESGLSISWFLIGGIIAVVIVVITIICFGYIRRVRTVGRKRK